MLSLLDNMTHRTIRVLYRTGFLCSTAFAEKSQSNNKKIIQYNELQKKTKTLTRSCDFNETALKIFRMRQYTILPWVNILSSVICPWTIQIAIVLKKSVSIISSKIYLLHLSKTIKTLATFSIHFKIKYCYIQKTHDIILFWHLHSLEVPRNIIDIWK